MPRAESVQQVFDAMPAHFKADQAPGLNAVIQFDLSGDGGGQWYVTVANGGLNVSTGLAAAPNVTIATSAQNYLAIINGEMKPVAAFMQGKVKVKGDVGLVMKLQNLFAL